jgi:hypothetical protein
VDHAFQAKLAASMSTLTQAATDIRTTFDALYGRDGQVVLSLEAKDFRVGRAHCSTSGRLDVCRDRLDYQVHHPKHGKVHMVM